MTRPPIPLEARPTRLLEDRVRNVFRHLPAALAGEEHAVHQLRVASRRARVALPVLARKPRGRRVRRARRILQDLVRTAAACRDLDVSVALLDEHLGRPAAPETALLRRRLRAARARSRRRMTEGLLDQDVARLRQDLRTVLGRRAEDLPIVLARLAEARDAAAAEAGAVLTALGERFDPEALHGLRTYVRRLRYLAEVDAGLRDEPSRAAKAFKTLQERLGQIHDAWILGAWLGRQAAVTDGRGESARASAAHEIEAVFIERAREHHRSFLAEDPAASLRRALALVHERAPAPVRLAR